MADLNKWRKRISLFLFILAVAYAIPPFAVEPFSDFLLNLPTATFISKQFSFSLINSLLMTYTLVPLLLILLSSIIHPSDTFKVFNGRFIKLKSFFIGYISKVKKNPWHLAWLVGFLYVLWIIFTFYRTQINAYLLT